MSLFRRHEQPRETPESQEGAVDIETQKAERSHVEELTAAFQESWEKNHKEGDPDVSFKMFLSRHADETDISQNLRSELEDTDIYLTEISSWTPSLMRKWNQISSGKKNPSSGGINFPIYELALQEVVHKTGVLVMSPDIRIGHPLEKESDRVDAMWPEVLKLPFDEAVPKYEEYCQAQARETQAREMEIMKNIPNLIRRALKKNKALRKKESLSVTMTYGGAHTALYQALRATENSVNREMGVHVFPRDVELQRNYIFGVDNTERNRKLAAYALIENVIYPASRQRLVDLGANATETVQFRRLAVDQLEPEDLSEIWGVRGGTDETPDMREAILGALEKKGITVPKTREELDDMLQVNRKP